MSSAELSRSLPARTLLVMAGGTGGHVFPALAVADALAAKGWKVVWLGTLSGLEAQLVPQRGYEMAWVKFSGVRRSGFLRWALLPSQLLLAFVQSALAIFRHRPHVVLGMGGYVSFPGGMMAALFAKPLVIHEQNSIAGLSNRILVCLAEKVMVAFPSAFSGAKDKPLLCAKPATTWCGNPVRPEIVALPEPEERFAGRSGPLRILVVGGSLGAAALNETVPLALALLPAEARPEVVHQSGTRHLEALTANYSAAGVSAQVLAFIEDMATLYAWCDLVICRSGALTVSELAVAGIASILVPYPYAVDDHQTQNGRFLSEMGAALLIQQTELTPERLAELLRGMDRKRLLEMAQVARAQRKADAARMVAEACEELAA